MFTFWRGDTVKLILIILSIVLIAIASYSAGYFSSNFNLNLCYSDAVSLIGEYSDKEANNLPVTELINSLSLRGYETSCDEILVQIKNHMAK